MYTHIHIPSFEGGFKKFLILQRDLPAGQDAPVQPYQGPGVKTLGHFHANHKVPLFKAPHLTCFYYAQTLLQIPTTIPHHYPALKS